MKKRLIRYAPMFVIGVSIRPLSILRIVIVMIALAVLLWTYEEPF